MNQTEQLAILRGVATQLTDFGTQLDADVSQLGKALNECVVALSNLGNTGPEVDAAMATLQSAANALTGKGDGLRTVAQSLDDLNADAPAP